MSATAELEPFIAPAELRAALAEPDLPDDVAQWLCVWGSAAVRAEVGQTISVVVGDVIVLDGTGSELILLPEIAVLDVSSVAFLDRELEVRRDYDWTAAGRLLARRGLLPAAWPALPRSVEVIYDHGWLPNSPQFQAARRVALELASRTFRNPQLLQSERIGDWSRAWVPTGGRSELTAAELRSLDLLRPGR